jgi:DNA-binding transcriptional ArsR family regulator
MTSVGEESAAILEAVSNPVRLPILLALEDRPRSVADLARDLHLPYDSIDYAMRAMRRAGLVEVVAQGITRTNLIHKDYGVVYTGWSRLVDALDGIAATRRDPASA